MPPYRAEPAVWAPKRGSSGLVRPWIAVLALVSMVFSGSAQAADSIVEYVKVRSEALKRSIPVGVYLPPEYDEEEDTRFPVLYFLHGMFGDHRKWEERGCPDILDELIEEGKVPPMIVVAPSGERSSFWVNWVNGKNNWEEFVTSDLVQTIDKDYRTIADRDHRGITGDSMGGYGALNLGFKHPALYGSVSAHSAMLYSVELEDLPDWVLARADSWGPIYGSPVDEDHWRANHPIHLASTLDEKSLSGQQIYFDCGSEDRFGFDSGARSLAKVLKGRKIPHESFIRDGNHGSGYFRRYVPISMGFHGAAFKKAIESSEGASNDDSSAAAGAAEDGADSSGG